METITAQQTQAGYVDALTVGPNDFEAITGVVFNASVVMQVFQLGPGGSYQTGSWADELLVAASADVASPISLARCGGARFRTNAQTPTTPGRVTCWAWRAGEPQVTAQVSTGGTLGGGGGLTGVSLITGRVNAAGAVAAGTGFTAARNSAGDYSVAFGTLTAIPLVIVQTADNVNQPAFTAEVYAKSTGGFSYVVYNIPGGAVGDCACDFVVIPFQ